jgi:Tol biopolymer transport system component
MSLKRAIGLLAAATLVVAGPASAASSNGRLAYAVDGQVFSSNSDGTFPKLLHGGVFPAFSPDGTHIVFADDPVGPQGGLTIYVADADGSNARQIGADFRGQGSGFAWSPDGTRIAFTSGDSQAGFSVVVLKADGRGGATVSADAAPDTPSWSPDGSELAFTTANDTDIAIAKADGSGRRLLIQDATRDTSPSWSPDGSEIAFFRERFGGFFVLYTIKPDASGLHQLGQTQADTTSPPAWSPDSSRLVFAGREQIGYDPRYGPYFRNDVYTVGADGAGERRLTDSVSLGAGSSPIWSPDGTRIAFLSSREGYDPQHSQLFVMNQNGTCETQLTSSDSPVSHPSWQALATGGPSDPLQCAALSITGSLDAATDHPALDDSRVYIYRGVVENNGNVTSDPLRLVTVDGSPFSYIAASASTGSCTFGASVSCALPALPPGGTIEFEFRFNVFVAGTFESEPEVEGTGSTPDGDLSDNADDTYRTFPFCEISTQDGSTLRAGSDDDLICGTLARDLIFAGGGNDRVYPGGGHNVVHAGAGDDEVQGGGATDVVYGDSGRDRLYGNYGNDVLIGGSGPDLLWGGGGGDYLKGGPGADRFFGGYGNDLIDSRDGVTEHVYCGEGKDRVEADLRDIVSPDCEKIVRLPAQARAPR